MLELKHISLKDVVLFKDVSFSVNANGGLVVITGLNKDSHEPENTNGAGKSLLWSGLPNVLFESTPLSVKKTNKKDILDEKESSISIEYNGVNNSEYSYTQLASKYVVIEDGEDLGIGKQEVAKKKLNATFPMTQEEFYSTCYIQNLKPLAFQHSTDTDRLKFLTDMFDLHIFDHIRKEVHEKLKSIKDSEIEFKTLSSQLDEVLRRQSDLESNQVSKKKIEKLEKEKKKLNKSIKDLIKLQQKLEDQHSKISKATKLYAKKESLQSKLPKISGLKDKLKSSIKSLGKYENYLESYDDYSKSAKQNLNKLKELEGLLGTHVGDDIDKIRSDYEKVVSKLDKAEEDYASSKDLLKSIKDIEKSKAKLAKELKSLNVDTTARFDKDDLSMYRQTVSMYTRLSEHDHGDGCPTCGSELDLDTLAKLSKKAKSKLKQHSLIKDALSLEDEISESKEELDDLNLKLSKLPKLKTLKSSIAKLTKQETKLGELGVNLKTYIQETRVNEGLTKPKKVSKPKLDLTLEEMEQQLEDLQEYEVVVAKLDSLDFDDSLDPNDLVLESGKASKRLSKKSKEESELQEVLTSAKINKAELKTSKKLSKGLSKKLLKIEAFVAERKLYEYLYKKYNANDLKLRAASSIMSIVETSLNTYSSLVFVEKTVFRLRPSKQGVLAQYKTSENGKWADIRSLSGAETNCFRLLFAISLLPLIPEHRRTNFIVLDEPDAACSPVIRQRLIKDFLPKLRSIVPHVFWVTPKESDSFKEAEVWTVVKEGGVSTLIKG